MSAFVLHVLQRSWLKISLSSRDICCRVHELQGHSSVKFRCFEDPTGNPCLTLAHKISATWPCRDLCRPIPFRQMRQKKDTQSQQCMFTCRFIQQTSASRWRADSHADLFTVEHSLHGTTAIARRLVWTRMPARSFAKVHLHLVDVHRCVVCTRNTEVETFQRCRLSSHRIIQSGLRQVQCQGKSCNNGHQPPSKNNKRAKLFRRGSFCVHVRQVDTNVVNQDNTPPALTTQRYHYHK